MFAWAASTAAASRYTSATGSMRSNSPTRARALAYLPRAAGLANTHAKFARALNDILGHAGQHTARLGFGFRMSRGGSA